MPALEELLGVFLRPLNALGLPYMVTGSVAGVFYGEPRITHDVDLVLQLTAGPQLDALQAIFPLDAYYCPPAEVLRQEALRQQRGQFNLIHHATGFTADVYLANQDPLHHWALSERRAVPVSGETCWLAPLEYVIVRKLEYYREGGSEKHLRDIRAMHAVSGADIRPEVLQRWVKHLGLEAQLAACV
ncbi:MAG: hypothetical protein ACPGUV_01550 [Polyangiales bacterium]